MWRNFSDAMASSKPPLSMSRGKNYHSRKSQQTVYLPVNPTSLSVNPSPGLSALTPSGLPVNPVASSGPVVTLHSAATNFTAKQRLIAPTTPIAQGQTMHIPIPPPPPPYTPVLMSVPPPPIRHISVHQQFAPRAPPPVTTNTNGNLPPGVHIHHGHILQDTVLSVGIPTSNGLDRPQATYYSHSALSHHHHQIVNINGNCQMAEVHSPTTITTAATSANQDANFAVVVTSSNGFSSPASQMNDLHGSHDHHHHHNQQQQQAQEVKENVKIKEKTPMCLINELARHNKIAHQYRLTDESGPSHKKSFTVCLKLGDTEEYLATGPSIKKAQHAAAAMAIEKTKLKHPAPKVKTNSKQVPVTPTVELNTLAMRRGESAVYTFLDQKSNQNGAAYAHKLPHKRYSNGTNGYANFRVSLKVGNREFFGEAATAQAAKHDAAMNALKILKELPVSTQYPVSSSGLNPKSQPFIPSSQKCNLQNSEADNQNLNSADGEDDEPNSDLVKSPISLVHETALKRNLVAHFEVTKETGPPHMRKFITRCRCGEFVTEGEGNGKKTSKKRAAEMMLDKLRQLPPLISCQSPTAAANKAKSRISSKKADMKKRKAKNLIKLEQKAAPEYGQSINPISRLIQIQQAKKEKEPVYTLIAEKGMPRRREFVMQVTVGVCTAKGSGPNKKLAKRAAAEALLQELGYSPKPPGLTGAQPAKPVLKPVGLGEKSPEKSVGSEAAATTVKKLTFSDEAKPANCIPGLIVIPKATNGDSEASTSVRRVNVEMSGNPNPTTVMESNQNSNTSSTSTNIKSQLSPKVQLASLAEALSIKISYRHINKKDKNDNFVSLVKLTTNPPKVFYGSGSTLELSQIDAASKALLAIADSGIEEESNDEA